MIEREHNIIDPAEMLAAYLEANRSGYRALRRRAVINYSSDKWTLLACTVEAITSDAVPVNAVASRHYPQAILFEDWPSIDDFLDFVRQIKEGRMRLGEHTLEATDTHRQWSREQVPLSNIHMVRAGHVLNARFDTRNANTYGALLAPDQPYYPDLTEAVRHWLPFPVYHGNSDGRNGEIVLLLPETRAYLCDAIPDGEVLDVQVTGTQVGELSLVLKGAWWEADGIHHIDTKVSGGHAQLHIPEIASRLEYILTDSRGIVYDYQREDRYRHSGLGRKRLTEANASLAEMVREACRNGEGLQVEFKPFIDLDIKNKNEKLSEVVRTVVAFANAQGGRIFLGIDDDCGLLGVDDQLSKWAGTGADETVFEKYLGALRGRIRDVVVGDPAMQFKQIIVDGRMIAIIEVSEARERPISIRQDKCLYVRRGSSNSKALPEEWKTILCAQKTNFRD